MFLTSLSASVFLLFDIEIILLWNFFKDRNNYDNRTHERERERGGKNPTPDIFVISKVMCSVRLLTTDASYFFDAS